MDIGEAFDQVKSAVTGEKTGRQQRAEQQQRDQRTNDSRGQQQTYNTDGDQQSRDAGAGYDPANIDQHDNWSSWDHKRMKSMVDGIDTGAIRSKGTDWQSVGSDIRQTFANFHSTVTGSVKAGWTGDASNAAATAPDGMAKWGSSMAAASEGTGSRMQQASTAADQARINMPEPQDFNWKRTLWNGATGGLTGGVGGAVTGGVGDAFDQHNEQQQAKQQAVNVMDRMYTQGYVDVDHTTPAFANPDDAPGKDHHGHIPPEPPPVKPPRPVGIKDRHSTKDGTGDGSDNQHGQVGVRHVTGGQDGLASVGNGTGGDSTGSTGGTNGTGGTGGNQQENPIRTGTSGVTDPSALDPTGFPGGTGGTGGPGGAGGAGGFDPHSTSAGLGAMGGMPVAGGPGGLGGDNAYGGRGFGPGGSGTGSGFGSGGRGAGGGVGAGAEPGGRSGAGIGAGAAAAEEAALARGAAGRGAAGAGGAPFGAGAGRRGEGEDDQEHQTPDYLVETDDVFGSGEMVAPPVIGE